MRDDTASPVVVIDCSRNRIRIHRTALHLLGNPDYVALLVNPTNLTFAIVPSEKSQISHAVRWERLLSNRCFELYSKPLIPQLCSVFPGWNTSEQFRMTGEYIPVENLIRFNLSNTVGRSTVL